MTFTELSSLSASTLMKLVQIRADEAYSGSFTVFVNEGSYIVAFGLPALGFKQAARLESCPTLKAALVTALVEEPFFSDVSLK